MSDDVLAKLRSRFRQQAGVDAQAVGTYMTGSLGEAGEIERLVHRLAGSAAMFGFAELGLVAAALDAKFADGTVPAPSELLELEQELRRASLDT